MARGLVEVESRIPFDPMTMRYIATVLASLAGFYLWTPK